MIEWRISRVEEGRGIACTTRFNVWLDGNRFTVGDLMMISVLGGLRGSAELADFPGLAAYIARGGNRPAHRKAMEGHMATFDAPVCA